MGESHADELAFLDKVFSEAKDHADDEGEEDLEKRAVDDMP
jgi:hypothetical protein